MSDATSDGTSEGAGTPGVTSERVTVNGVDLAVLRAGDHGPLAVCLHGFPDSAHTWRHLAPRLAAAGYRVVAPFMRGYAPSAVAPDGRYQTAVLALDADALHDAFDGDGDAVLIGHDWGAIAVYGAASHSPDRWRSVVAMAVPPGGAMGAAFLGNLDQLKRSWYMFFFQHGLADMVVPANDLAFIDMIWRDWSPGYDAAADLVHVKEALRDPANLAAALGYYRATLGDGYRDPDLDDVQAATQAVPAQPTLYLHGADDGCVGAEVAESSRSMVDDHITVEVLPGCGHFLHLERPDDVNERIVGFLP